MPLALAVATSAHAQTKTFDAVAAAPQSHLVLFEDNRICVLRVEVAPGVTAPVHNHRWPSVMSFGQPQPITHIEFKLVGGRPVETKRIDAPALKATQAVRGNLKAFMQ